VVDTPRICRTKLSTGRRCVNVAPELPIPPNKKKSGAELWTDRLEHIEERAMELRKDFGKRIRFTVGSCLGGYSNSTIILAVSLHSWSALDNSTNPGMSITSDRVEEYLIEEVFIFQRPSTELPSFRVFPSSYVNGTVLFVGTLNVN
jgi:hypothetical protein